MFTRLKNNQYLYSSIAMTGFLVLVLPTIISYAPYPLSWDPAYYLHNAVCMNHAVFPFALSRVGECLEKTSKGPIMEIVTLPWGRIGGTYIGVSLSFVALGLFVWALVMATYLTCVRAAIPLWALLLGAITILLTPFLQVTAGDMMTDTLLGWAVALGLMLIPLEYNVPQSVWWQCLLRGLLWGVVLDIGSLAKVTFGFFVLAIGAVLILIRWYRSGMRSLLYSLIGCAIGASPAVVIWWRYGGTFFRFASAVAWGNLAHLWSVPGLTASGYWKQYFSELRWALVPLILAFLLFVRGFLLEKSGRIIRLLPLGIITTYLVTAGLSQNRDPRFTIPVMIAMPLCLAWTGQRSVSPGTPSGTAILSAIVMVILFTIPMVGRPDIGPIQRTGLMLRLLTKSQPANVVLATDGGVFNVETVELARQLEGNSLQAVHIDTLVYDQVNGRSLEEGLARIDNADFVLFLKAGNDLGPDWTRTRTPAFRVRCEKGGILLDGATSPDFDIFQMKKR